MFDYYLLLLFPAAMAVAAMLDLFSMTIPNRISLILLGGFLVIAPLTGMAWEQFFIHIAIAFAVLVVGFALFAFGLVGGGDAKLLTVAALWIGYDDLMSYLYVAALFGAALAVAILLYRRNLPPKCFLGQQWALRLHARGEGVPYGIALACGALWVFPSTSWFLAVAI